MISSVVNMLARFEILRRIFKVCYCFFLRLTARLSKMEASSDSNDAESDCSSDFSDISDRENACDGPVMFRQTMANEIKSKWSRCLICLIGKNNRLSDPTNYQYSMRPHRFQPILLVLMLNQWTISENS